MSTERQPATERVAVFPLNVVLFPGGLLTLRIFEPRYLRMVSECLKQQQPFAVATIVDAGPEAGGVAMTAPIATLAGIVDWEQGEDGLLHLVCEGEQRCQIHDLDVESDQLLRASITRLRESMPRPVPRGLEWTERLLREWFEEEAPTREPAMLAPNVIARTALTRRRSRYLVRLARRGYSIGHAPVTTVYGDEVSSINPFVDTGRFFRLVFKLLIHRE